MAQQGLLGRCCGLVPHPCWPAAQQHLRWRATTIAPRTLPPIKLRAHAAGTPRDSEPLDVILACCPYGSRICLSVISTSRFGGRRPDNGIHDVGERTFAGASGPPGGGCGTTPRPFQGFYHRGIENLRRCPGKHQAQHTGSRRSLGHGQSNASSVFTTNHGERREDNAPDYGHLFCPPKDTRRTARADKKGGRNGSPSGIQRGGAGRTARSHPLMRHISRANASDGSIFGSGVVAQALGQLRTAGC